LGMGRFIMRLTQGLSGAVMSLVLLVSYMIRAIFSSKRHRQAIKGVKRLSVKYTGTFSLSYTRGVSLLQKCI